MATLPRYFAALVRASFDADTLAEINRRNAANPGQGCATHDFMDANALMFGAWATLYFEEPDLSKDEVLEEMNVAWDAARAANFAN